ncbi:MAG: hypothetical protein ACD_4C00112G0002 [uncultured bacterium (gcode 4)]|uniref:Uncharacterized protein n=1 Tax=uncultured bacterium (gcode 4) TaxID=1234023 RepID=K2FYH0_9BACT|nr:MAG: hypothetical protein ACD_4C00112G0002 [uncultured bacterium (gcode 4)]
MNKKIINTTLLVFIFLLIASFLYVKEDITWAKLNWTKKKDEIIQTESKFLLKNVKKFNYNQSYSGFILKEFQQSDDIYFSGSIFNFDWKSFSWKSLYVSNIQILKDGSDFIFKDESLSKSNWNTDKNITYLLRFIKGFSKMKLMWSGYDFDENNLKNWNLYDFNLFISWNIAFVISFENITEAKDRKKLFDEYKKKVEEVKNKYSSDPYVSNKLINELNKAYWIKISLLQ